MVSIVPQEHSASSTAEQVAEELKRAEIALAENLELCDDVDSGAAPSSTQEASPAENSASSGALQSVMDFTKSLLFKDEDDDQMKAVKRIYKCSKQLNESG